MTIRTLLRMGDPRLLETARPVAEFGTSALDDLIRDMHDTMAAAGGVGLAAPQIGVGLRVVIFGFEQNERYPEAEPAPMTILINPHITPLSDEEELGLEGCLSVPGLRGEVPRYRRIRYQGFDPRGRPIDRTVEGFHARVVQHECDHLIGMLYPMRVRDLSRLGFTDVLPPRDPGRLGPPAPGGNPADCRIDFATTEDLPALADLLGELFTQEADFAPDRERQLAGLARIQGDPRVGRLFVLKLDGRVAGMANALFSVSTALGERVLLLEDVIIAAPHRGRGLGRALLERVFDWAKREGISRVTLLADADNQPALDFYGVLGFQPSAMRVLRRFLPRA